jgi:hypothetical protein
MTRCPSLPHLTPYSLLMSLTCGTRRSSTSVDTRHGALDSQSAPARWSKEHSLGARPPASRRRRSQSRPPSHGSGSVALARHPSLLLGESEARTRPGHDARHNVSVPALPIPYPRARAHPTPCTTRERTRPGGDRTS